MSKLYFDPGKPRVGNQKVLLATTAYDGADASYTFSIQRSRDALHRASIETAYLLLSGNCHVDDARNSVVQEFLDTDCTELVFLDADVSWEPAQLVRLCEHEVDLVGGVYPFRSGDKRDSMPVRMLPGEAPDNRGLIEVEGLPAGFMRITRDAILKMMNHSESYTLKKADSNPTVHILFERTLEQGTRWGGDLKFCHKWRAIGGKVYADYDMRLGHAAKEIVYGSLGETMRRRAGSTLRDICAKIARGESAAEDCREAYDYVGNRWGLQPDSLDLAVRLARRADGPILEAGSGLSTVLMAAASSHMVFALEHDPFYAMSLEKLVRESGVTNVAVCLAPLKDGWYDPAEFDGLPDSFAFGLCDGPPRYLGSRAPFAEHFRIKEMMFDDVDDPEYLSMLKGWAKDNFYADIEVDARALVLRAA